MIDVGVDASAFLGFEGEIVKGCFEIFDPFPRNGGGVLVSFLERIARH
jgi:hypothetical protein